MTHPATARGGQPLDGTTTPADYERSDGKTAETPDAARAARRTDVLVRSWAESALLGGYGPPAASFL